MTFQSANLAATLPRYLHNVLTTPRQPRRLRAMSTSARPVDNTVLNVTRFSPPFLYAR